MAIGDFDPNDPLSVVQGMQSGQTAGQALNKRRLGAQSQFPAANQFDPQQNTAFARNAPVNTPAQNNINVTAGTLNQIPVGGFGLGALSQAGYSRSPQMNLGNFMNQGNQQPTMTGFHWYAGTGGVSGGNNDVMRQHFSDGTTKSFTGGVQDNQSLAPTIWTQPGINKPGESGPYADVRALSDPSVNALAGAQRSTNRYGQQVINPSSGEGQIISGKAGSPSFGSLQGSTPAADAYNRPGLNTPSGGQAFAGPSLRKPMDRMVSGQNWSLGGWY